jgi:HAD superfamily hydrolase (TIGR01484 family)
MRKFDYYFFSDVDGVIDDFPKDVAPWEENLEPHITKLNYVKDFLEKNPKYGFSICTGRSLAATKNIINLTGTNTLSACEFGTMLYDPEKDKEICIIEKEYPHLITASYDLKIWKDVLPIDEIQEKLEKPVRYLHDRREIITIETTDGVTGTDLFHVMKGRIPSSIQEHLGTDIRLIISKKAIDITPNINKGDAIRYIRNVIKIPYERTIAVGDSSHSDEFMLAEARYRGCPGNSDEKMKKYVEQSGKNGHVSRFIYNEGLMDILCHAQKVWLT